jgi:hypothetical protein
LTDSREHGFDNLAGQPLQRHPDRRQDYVVGSRLDEIDQNAASGRGIENWWKVLCTGRHSGRWLARTDEDLN